ncbi:MAG: hypothetical protein AAGA67_13320 [Cyanobacteria bacterium P01_F01_bin.153]
MTHQVSTTSTPFPPTNRSFFSQSWVRVCLALTLISAQPLIAQHLRTNSPSGAISNSTSQPTFELSKAETPDFQSEAIATEQRAVIPPDRGAPDHTVGSGSR